MKPNAKTEEDPFHTVEERLVLEQIRIKALRYENKLLDEALRKSKLPTQEEFMRRIGAAAWKLAEKKVPCRRTKKKQKL